MHVLYLRTIFKRKMNTNTVDSSTVDPAEHYFGLSSNVVRDCLNWPKTGYLTCVLHSTMCFLLYLNFLTTYINVNSLQLQKYRMNLIHTLKYSLFDPVHYFYVFFPFFLLPSISLALTPFRHYLRLD